MLHDEGRSQDDVALFLERWSLSTPERARQSLQVPVLAAVAGVHQHLRRGIPAARRLAGQAAARSRAHRAIPASVRRAAGPELTACGTGWRHAE